jgi:hypothetical protein
MEREWNGTCIMTNCLFFSIVLLVFLSEEDLIVLFKSMVCWRLIEAVTERKGVDCVQT